MPFKNAILNREFDKFIESPADETAVRTLSQSINFNYLVSKGLIPGLSSESVRGGNTDVDNNSIESVWNVGGTYIFPSTGGQMEVVSTSANDTLAGTGAQKIILDTLDDNYDPVGSIVIDMNGTTPVLTTQANLFRLNFSFILATGANGSAEGDITIKIGGNTLGLIDRNLGRTTNAIFSVPNNFNAYLTSVRGNIAASRRSTGVKEGQVFLLAGNEGATFIEVISFGLSSFGTNAFDSLTVYPNILPEKSDVRADFISNQNNVDVSASFGFLLEDLG